MRNNTQDNEANLYLIQQEKTDYWGEKLCVFKMLLEAIFLTFFVLFTMYVSIWMIINKPEFLFKYIVSIIIIVSLIYLLSHVIYEMLGYKYFFKKRHRTRFYRKYMDRLLLAIFLTIIVAISLIVMSHYIEYYWLLGFTFLPMLFVFILPKHKKLKALYPPLEDLSLHNAIYREKFIEKYTNSLWFQFPLLTDKIKEIALVYYYLNIVIYDNEFEVIPLSEDNLYEKVKTVATQHIQTNNNEKLFNEIDTRAFKLNLRNDNFDNLLTDFFA